MNLIQQTVNKVQKSLLGKPEVVRLAVVCFFAEGHLLIDDIPGVGKTTLGLALSKAIGLKFQRVQFTSDLLPSDILGVSIFNQTSNKFEFKEGPLFANVVLADEINRASPKTQSALLEAMQEGQVSLDRLTVALPKPFFVIATQNPQEFYGTFPLPESQLDRFMMRLDIGYPSPEVEQQILRGEYSQNGHLAEQIAVSDLSSMMNQVKNVKVDMSLDSYLVKLATATRDSTVVQLGLSPRGTLALRRAAQGMALSEGRAFVIPDDIKAVAPAVISHRIKVRGHSRGVASFSSQELVVKEILGQVPVPS